MISIDYYDIYYAGTTDFVPELERIRCDVAILPLSAGPGTLDLERTVELVRALQPRWVIPSHWGTFGGTLLDVQALERALGGLATVVARGALIRRNRFCVSVRGWVGLDGRVSASRIPDYVAKRLTQQS